MARVLLDTWTAPDGTALSDYYPDQGLTWLSTGTWEIDSHRLSNTVDGGDVQAWQQGHYADGTLTAIVTTPGGAWNGSLLFNFFDTQNYWMLDLTSTGGDATLTLWRRLSGAYVRLVVWGDTPVPTDSTHTLAVTTDGDEVHVSLDGVAAFDYTETDRALKGASQIGFRRDSAGGAGLAYGDISWDVPIVPVSGGSLLGGAITSAFVAGSPFTGQILESSASCLGEAYQAWLRLQTSSFPLILFTNNPGLNPDTRVTDFLEASYSSYARRDTRGLWQEPGKVAAGHYRVTSLPLYVPAPTDAPVSIWGWALLTPDLENWIRAEQFPFPLTLLANADPFSLVISLDWVAWRWVL